VDIVITDDEDPTFVWCPSDITVNNDVDECGAVVNFTGPLAADNCAVESITQLQGLVNGSFFPVGTTTMEYEAEDPSGNTATCLFDITVNDAQNPEAQCQDITVYLD
ncbi:MAG: HYR domain-containing protein, partial [Saprospiraceae bacterium]|nr:HYR domain-containing protein [Saprospiraceae bacterium]